MATRKQLLLPLLDIQSAAFAKQYERGIWQSMSGKEQGKGPVSVHYFMTCLRQYEARGSFTHPAHLPHLGFCLGRYHGGVLSPHTGHLRPGVTTLATLDHPDARAGYAAGREWYFHEAEPQQRRLDEQGVIARLRELVIEDPYQQGDNADLWYYSLGCLLGDLSGHLFPETSAEAQAWQQACRQCSIELMQEASLSLQGRV